MSFDEDNYIDSDEPSEECQNCRDYSCPDNPHYGEKPFVLKPL